MQASCRATPGTPANGNNARCRPWASTELDMTVGLRCANPTYVFYPSPEGEGLPDPLLGTLNPVQRRQPRMPVSGVLECIADA